MIGIFSKTTDSNVIKCLGISGYDFVILDMEHGYSDYLKLSELINAALLVGIMPIVRVAGNNKDQIMKCLELGAAGVQIPGVSDKYSAQKAVEYSKFAPIGKRGVCRFVPEADFGTKDKQEYFRDENSKQLIIQIEGTDAIQQLDEILSVDNIDIIFIGPYDLSQSLGIPGDITNSEVTDLINEIIRKSATVNKSVGIFTDTSEDFKKYKSMGVSYIAHSVDLNVIAEAFQSRLNSINTLWSQS